MSLFSATLSLITILMYATIVPEKRCNSAGSSQNNVNASLSVSLPLLNLAKNAAPSSGSVTLIRTTIISKSFLV